MNMQNNADYERYKDKSLLQQTKKPKYSNLDQYTISESAS